MRDDHKKVDILVQYCKNPLVWAKVLKMYMPDTAEVVENSTHIFLGVFNEKKLKWGPGILLDKTR